MNATKLFSLQPRKKEKILRALITRFLLVFCMTLISLYVAAQEKDSSRRNQVSDTTKPDLISGLRKLGEKAAQKSQTKFKEEQVAARQDNLFENIRKITEDAESYVETGIDSTGIKDELEEIERWYTIVSDGIFTNTGTSQTHRNLATSTSIVRELLNRATIRKNLVDRYRRDLIGFRNVIDSLASDSSLYNFSLDSAVLVNYIDRLLTLASEIRPTDSVLKRAIANIENLQKHVNQLENKLHSGLDEIENYRQQISKKTFYREFANLWDPKSFSRPIREILNYSIAKDKLILGFYSKNHREKIFFLVLLIVACFLFLNSLKQRVKKENLSRQSFEGHVILRYPLLSSTMIILNLFQFIFPGPPFIFSCLIWIIASICLTIISWHHVTKNLTNSWLILFLLFLLACADNLILQASRTERWIMLLLSIAGIFQGIATLIKGKKMELREKKLVYFIGFVVLLELVSSFANLIGRYNFSKTLLTSGFFSIVIAILFFWTVRLINEGLAIAKAVYERKEGKTVYIDFDRVGEKAHPLFYALLVAGWFILVGRNFYLFRFITEPFKIFLFEDRTIGSYTFKISSVLTFFLIMALSVLISKIVSFFASDTHYGSGGHEKRVGLGSWLLLIRITIISMGLFLAIAATGIPVDRITIILGALSVGVGLGLQALVNNLVSGLIIAFEKPVNVGDQVEIEGRSGRIKSIGFRSSIVSTYDGADVIIPNGDLLKAHLVNWTLGKSRRRADLPVGVAFGTDLQKTKKLLEELMGEDKRILPYPSPIVLFQQFSSSSIDIKLFFWTKPFNDPANIKSDLIAAIDHTFKENGIEIPYPQQDLHIRTVSEKSDSISGLPDPKK